MKSKILILLVFLNLSAICFAQIDKAKRLFHEEEDYSSALKLFKKESAKNESYEVKFFIASCYFKMEKFAIAKEHFLAIIPTEISQSLKLTKEIRQRLVTIYQRQKS
jgi:thioredoxin-like negative regulator of GroEL